MSDHTHICERLSIHRIDSNAHDGNYALFDRGGRLFARVGWLSISYGDDRGVPFAFGDEAEFGGTCTKTVRYANPAEESVGEDVTVAAGARIIFE